MTQSGNIRLIRGEGSDATVALTGCTVFTACSLGYHTSVALLQSSISLEADVPPG